MSRSEEHTSELQSPCNLVCRLLLEKKKDVQLTDGLAYQTGGLPTPSADPDDTNCGTAPALGIHACCASPTPRRVFFFFFFNDTATTEIYTLSLHDALPI